MKPCCWRAPRPPSWRATAPRGARLAKDKGASVLVMDDGHQNFSLRKTSVAGGGGCRDRLRQWLSDSGRTLARAGGPGPGARRCGDRRGRRHARSAGLSPARCCAPIWKPMARPSRASDVFAFAGIGRPEKFIASLEDSGAHITGSCFFADHHPYTRRRNRPAARWWPAMRMLVTTEKDFVRLTIAAARRHQGAESCRRLR